MKRRKGMSNAAFAFTLAIAALIMLFWQEIAELIRDMLLNNMKFGSYK
jgi:hypothetical protein